MSQTLPRPAHDLLIADSFDAHYSRAQRLAYLAAAIAAGVMAAGFWNFRLVDEFGSQVIAANTIGGYQGKAAQFAVLGAGFGFVFAAVAGLAATIDTSRRWRRAGAGRRGRLFPVLLGCRPDVAVARPLGFQLGWYS